MKSRLLLKALQNDQNVRMIGSLANLFRDQMSNSFIFSKRYMRAVTTPDDDLKQTRMNYVDFIDESLAKMKQLGLDKDIKGYKELLKVFPEKKYHPRSRYDIGMFHAPQQLCAIRVINQMISSGIKPDKEIELIVESRFSRSSQVWLKVTREMYWGMKGRNIDKYPLPEKLPERPHELAKLGLERMVDDIHTSLILANTSSVPDAIDKTWVAYTQSLTQSEIIDKLDDNSVLHLEYGGITYVQQHYLNYYILKIYDDEAYLESIKKPEVTYNFNRLKVKFYNAPIKEKLRQAEESYHIDNYRLLAIGMTGTSSNDSLSSWLKIMQRRNPKLSKLSVVFETSGKTPEIALQVTNQENPQSDSGDNQSDNQSTQHSR